LVPNVHRGVPEAPHLSKDDHDRIQGFVHLKSLQVVEDFKVWIANVPDPDGAITSLCHFYFAFMLYLAGYIFLRMVETKTAALLAPSHNDSVPISHSAQ
jgi:hypothetical protein